MLAFVEEHCCYGKAPANEMHIRNIIPSSAYHVSDRHIDLFYPSTAMLSFVKVTYRVRNEGHCGETSVMVSYPTLILKILKIINRPPSSFIFCGSCSNRLNFGVDEVENTKTSNVTKCT